MYKNTNWKLALFAVTFISLIILSGCKTKKSIEIPAEQEITGAYTYLFSRYLVLQQENYDINVEKAGYNKIKYNPLGSAQFVNPNLDVAYLEAWIAVDSVSAVILNIPEIKDRYYTAQLLDGWGEVIVNINDRTYPDHPYGKFALVLQGSTALIPDGALKIVLPAKKAKLLARVELKGSSGTALSLQQSFTLDAPATIHPEPPVAIPEFTNTRLIGAEIFDKVQEVLSSYPDKMPEAKQFQEVVQKVAQYRESSDTASSRVETIVKTKAIPGFLKSAKGFGIQKGGWSVAYSAGNFGNDIMARAIINYGGLWANVVNEAIYFVGLTDQNKELLHGDQTYEIHFPANQLPDNFVNGFWSLTLYSVPDYHLAENELKRYNLNNQSKLVPNQDGSVSIWVAPVLPENVPDANWLPSPKGKDYALNMRMYVAKEPVLNGKWFPAPLVKL